MFLKHLDFQDVWTFSNMFFKFDVFFELLIIFVKLDIFKSTFPQNIGSEKCVHVSDMRLNAF